MAKTEKDPLRKTSALMAKALQRGEKLERTLTKLVAHSDPGSATEGFLKAVQDGLKAIHKGTKPNNAKAEAKKSETKKKAAKATKDKTDLMKPDGSAKKPLKRKAAVKKPAAEAVPPIDTSVSE